MKRENTNSDRVEFTHLKQSAAKGLNHSTSVFLTLLLVIGALAAVYVYYQRATDENNFKSLMDSASRADASRQFAEAAALRTDALAIAKRLFKPQNVLADLDMEIDRTWVKQLKEQFAAMGPGFSPTQKYTIRQNKATVQQGNDEARKPHLREALAYYSPRDTDRLSDIARARWELAEVLTAHSLTPESHTGFLGQTEMTFSKSQAALNPRGQPPVGSTTIVMGGNVRIPREGLRQMLPGLHRAVYNPVDSLQFFQSEQSLDQLLQSAGISPYSLGDRMQLAREADSANDLEGVVVEYTRCLGLQPTDDLIDKWRKAKEAIPSGDIDHAAANNDEAMASLLKLREEQKQSKSSEAEEAKISFAIANVFNRMHRYAEAKKEIDTLATKQKRSAQANFCKGIILAEQGNYIDATQSLQTALSLAHAHREEISSVLANLEISIGQFDKAAKLMSPKR